MSDITKAIKEAREKSKKRNFMQSVDLIVTLKNIDLKKPENTFVEEIELPNGRGKKAKVGIIGNELSLKSKNDADFTINEAKLKELKKDNKKVKKIVNSCDFFIAEPALMMQIGKTLGRVLGPRGKMPKPVPPQANSKQIIEKLNKTIRVKLKETPVIQCIVGNEKLSDEQIEENIKLILNQVTKKLSKGEQNIKTVQVKLTMGAPIKIR